jgi:hypothetical protein
VWLLSLGLPHQLNIFDEEMKKDVVTYTMFKKTSQAAIHLRQSISPQPLTFLEQLSVPYAAENRVNTGPLPGEC